MDDDHPRSRAPENDFGAASLLAGESLDRFSLDELDARIALLEAAIVRTIAHRSTKAAHRSAADAMFKSQPAPGGAS